MNLEDSGYNEVEAERKAKKAEKNKTYYANLDPCKKELAKFRSRLHNHLDCGRISNEKYEQLIALFIDAGYKETDEIKSMIPTAVDAKRKKILTDMKKTNYKTAEKDFSVTAHSQRSSSEKPHITKEVINDLKNMPMIEFIQKYEITDR